MGKKNESKYDKLTYTAKRAADKRMAEQYGIDLSQYGNTERPGASYSGKKSWDDLSADVAKAAANDYDVRRTVELAQESGNKKALKLGQGISNASEAYAATRFMEKTHKNRMDNGGAYDGANDQGGVTDYWKQKVMDKRAASVQQPSDPKPEKEDTTQQFKDLSARAQELVGMNDNTLGSTGTKSSSMSYDPDAGVSNAEAGDFLSDYSFKVKDRQKREGVPTRGAGAQAGRLN